MNWYILFSATHQPPQHFPILLNKFEFKLYADKFKCKLCKTPDLKVFYLNSTLLSL